MNADRPVLRLFVAVPIGDDAREALARHLDAALRGPLPGRVVPPANWHITLRFLGDVHADAEPRLIAALDGARMPHAFEITFGRLGAFPSAPRARTVWLGVEEGSDALARLAAAVDDAVRACGFAADRRFAAHLTLARLRRGDDADVRRTIERVPPAAVRLTVGWAELMSSTLGNGPPAYALRHRIALPPAAGADIPATTAGA